MFANLRGVVYILFAVAKRWFALGFTWGRKSHFSEVEHVCTVRGMHTIFTTCSGFSSTAYFSPSRSIGTFLMGKYITLTTVYKSVNKIFKCNKRETVSLSGNRKGSFLPTKYKILFGYFCIHRLFYSSAKNLDWCSGKGV